VGFVLPLIVAVIGVWIAFSIVVWATGQDTLLDTGPTGAPPGLGDGDPVSEAAIASVKFDTGLRGYRTDQVDAALYRLAWEIGRKDEQLAALRAELGHDEPEDAPEEDEAELFEEPLDEDAYRLLRDTDEEDTEARAESEEPGSEAGREDQGEATPRQDA
jgi:DivIVA domain-containing protein